MDVLAHGLSGREDLPIPFTYALTGAGIALVVSFALLGLLWRTPRLRENAGTPVPAGLARAIDSAWLRTLLRVFGLVALAYVVLAAVFGKDDALNPTAGVIYVLLWIGVPLLSMLVGPVWRLLNPIRTLHLGLSRLVGTRPAEGLAPLPPRLGYWPAAFSLLVFVWLELVAEDNTTLPVLRVFLATYVAGHLIAATYWGSRWFDRGDGFEVFSDLAGRLSVLGRRDDGQLVVRNPLSNVANLPVAPGLYAVVGVLLGSTIYDSFSSSPAWLRVLQDSPASTQLLGTAGLLVAVGVVTGGFAGVAALTGRGSALSARQVAGQLAHSLVPIVMGYVVAHYWSLLVAAGQDTLIRLSDPLGTGANWLGTGDRAVDLSLVQPAFVSALQVEAVVLGHVLGVVLAHDRALRLLPHRHAISGQVPLLLLMLGYTIGGLWLLFAF